MRYIIFYGVSRSCAFVQLLSSLYSLSYLSRQGFFVVFIFLFFYLLFGLQVSPPLIVVAIGTVVVAIGTVVVAIVVAIVMVVVVV